MRTEPAAIREKTTGDAAACLDLLLRVQARDGYPMIRDAGVVPHFLKPDHELAAWVAEQDGQIVGHVSLRFPPGDPTLTAAATATGLPLTRLALVSRLFVDPDLRRHGLGRTLLRHATAHAPVLDRRAVLDVRKDLTPAVALYRSEGWIPAGDLNIPFGEGGTLDLWVFLSPPASPA